MWAPSYVLVPLGTFLTVKRSITHTHQFSQYIQRYQLHLLGYVNCPPNNIQISFKGHNGMTSFTIDKEVDFLQELQVYQDIIPL